MMRLIAIVAALTAVSAQAGQFKLTDSCKKKLESQVLESELARMNAQGDVLASQFQTKTFLNYRSNAETVTVTVSLEDSVDGRTVPYSARLLKSEALKCEIPLVRRDSSACRYSRYEGPESINEIRGLNFVSGRTINASSELSDLEERQIRAFLGSENSTENASLQELIESTDDKELTTGTLQLPGGSTLTYFGAYGGDNPFGVFFKAGTIEVAGNNGDGYVCIK